MGLIITKKSEKSAFLFVYTQKREEGLKISGHWF